MFLTICSCCLSTTTEFEVSVAVRNIEILWYKKLYTRFFFLSEVPSVCRLCSDNAECLLDVSSQEFTCQCRSNYRGDGFNCTQVDCRTEQICDPNADCMYDPFELRDLCLCRNGFTGESVTLVTESNWNESWHCMSLILLRLENCMQFDVSLDMISVLLSCVNETFVCGV